MLCVYVSGNKHPSVYTTKENKPSRSFVARDRVGNEINIRYRTPSAAIATTVETYCYFDPINPQVRDSVYGANNWNHCVNMPLGTTPLKWRKRSNSGSSGGILGPGEGSVTPAIKVRGKEQLPYVFRRRLTSNLLLCALCGGRYRPMDCPPSTNLLLNFMCSIHKSTALHGIPSGNTLSRPTHTLARQASEQGQDGVPPKITTRRPSWDVAKPPDTATGAPDDPAGFVRAPSTSSINATKQTVSTVITEDNANSTASRSIDDPGQSEGLGGGIHEDRRHILDEDTVQQQQHTVVYPQPPTGTADEGVETLAKETTARRKAVASNTSQDGREGEQLENHPTESDAETSARGDGAQPQSLPSHVGTTVGLNDTSSRAADTNSRELVAAEASAVGVHLESEGGREDKEIRIEVACSFSDGGCGLTSDGGGGSQPKVIQASHNDGKTLTTTPAPTGELGSNTDAEGGVLQKASEAASGTDFNTMQRRETSSGQPHLRSRGDSKAPIQEGELEPSEGDVASNAQKANVDNSENPDLSRKFGVGSQRRRSNKRNTLEGGGSDVKPRYHEIDLTFEAGDAEDNNKLLRSPPMLSRRTSSKGALERNVDLGKAVRPVDDLYTCAADVRHYQLKCWRIGPSCLLKRALRHGELIWRAIRDRQDMNPRLGHSVR